MAFLVRNFCRILICETFWVKLSKKAPCKQSSSLSTHVSHHSETLVWNDFKVHLKCV